MTVTGDFKGENIIQCSNLDFNEIKVYGDGSQSFRTVSMLFTEKEVHWIMDSPLEKLSVLFKSKYPKSK